MKLIYQLTNDDLGEILPSHETRKMSNGWMAKVTYNQRPVKIGYQTKTYYNVFTVTECQSEREARQLIYDHLKKKRLLNK